MAVKPSSGVTTHSIDTTALYKHSETEVGIQFKGQVGKVGDLIVRGCHSSGVGGVQSSDPLVFPDLVKGDIGEDVGEQQLKRWQKLIRDNISPIERRVIRHLKDHDDIIIKPVDKGSAVVVPNKEDKRLSES